MAGKLFNVRLDDADAARARSLQQVGIAVSDVMREALRVAHAKHVNGRRPKRTRALLEQIFDEVPEPPGGGPMPVNVHDRLAFQQYVRAHLTGKASGKASTARHQRPRRPQRAAR
jgi:hypothetical protein